MGWLYPHSFDGCVRIVVLVWRGVLRERGQILGRIPATSNRYAHTARDCRLGSQTSLQTWIADLTADLDCRPHSEATIGELARDRCPYGHALPGSITGCRFLPSPFDA